MNADALDFEFGGSRWKALPSGALWNPDRHCLVVADLHLGKGVSFAGEGKHLPPYDALATLDRLQADVIRVGAEKVMLLGDSFHRDDSRERLPVEWMGRLESMASERTWIWLMGNHDGKHLSLHGGSLPGVVMERWEEDGMCYRHQPEEGEEHQIFGHYHPKVRFQTHAGMVGGRCFLVEGNRLLLPAYGDYAGGLGWPGSVLRQWFRSPRVFLCHRRRVREIHVPG